MTTKELYIYAIDQASSVVVQVRPEQLTLPTPDTEWDVRLLLNHMLYELAWAADVAVGRTIEEVGDAYDGDLVGDNVQRSWRSYELATRQSIRAALPRSRVHLSYGDRPLNEYLLEAGNDQLVHAWDLGQAIGVKVVFHPDVVQVLYDYAVKNQESNVSSGLYASPVEVAATSNAQTKLLALLGRSENWEGR